MILFTAEIDPGKLSINGAKRAGARPGKGGKPQPFTRPSKRYAAAFAELVAGVLEWGQECGQCLEGPVALTLDAFWPRVNREGPAAGLALGDADAPIKAICDALQGGHENRGRPVGVLLDDAQIVEIHARKCVDRLRPRIVIRLDPAATPPSNAVEKKTRKKAPRRSRSA